MYVLLLAKIIVFGYNSVRNAKGRFEVAIYELGGPTSVHMWARLKARLVNNL